MAVNSESTAIKKGKCQVWRKRTLMERYLIIVCLLVCIAILAMIGLLVHLTYRPSVPPICMTALCKREAGRILSNMDLTTDPCDDFYTFSCGSFVKNGRLPTIGDRNDQEYFVAETMKELSKNLIEKVDDGPEFIKKMKKFYTSCLNKITDSTEIIEQFLLKVGLKFWPIEDEELPDMEEVLALTLLYRKENPFVLMFAVARINDGVLTIIGRGNLLVEREVLLNTTEESYAKKNREYRKLLEYALYKARAPFGTIDQVVDEVIEFETLLAETARDTNVTEYKEENSTMTINEIMPDCGKISLSNVLKYIYEYLGRPEYFSGETPVKVYNLEYLDKLCEIFKTTNDRILYNYIVWFFLATNLKVMDPYFKRKFRDIEDKDYFPLARWEECIHSMNENMFVAGISYLVLNHIQPDESLEEVKEYVLEVRKAMEQMFSEETWIDQSSKDALISQMWNISAELGYSSENLDEELLENHYRMVNVTDNYIENVLQLELWDRTKMLVNNSAPFLNNITISSPIKSSGYFTGDKFVITLGLLVPPFFIHNGPKFLNYGVTGFVIAHELTHAYDSLDSDTTDGNETVKVTNETIQRFIEKKKCYVDQYSKFPIGKDGNMVNGSKTFGDNIADNSGILQALAAYDNYLRVNGNEPQLPGLDYTNHQMFFITYSQQWCEVVKSEAETYKYDVHSPARYRVIGPLQNSPQFAKAFNCPLNSKMNPDAKCTMYG